MLSDSVQEVSSFGVCFVIQYWLDGDVLVGEQSSEQATPLPEKGDVAELGSGGDLYSVQTVDAQLGPDGNVSLVLVTVDDF